jgi:hypothetical protein
MGILLLSALLLAQPDILVIYFSGCLLGVENHRGKCHKNELYQNKNKQRHCSKTYNNEVCEKTITSCAV